MYRSSAEPNETSISLLIELERDNALDKYGKQLQDDKTVLVLIETHCLAPDRGVASVYLGDWLLSRRKFIAAVKSLLYYLNVHLKLLVLVYSANVLFKMKKSKFLSFTKRKCSISVHVSPVLDMFIDTYHIIEHNRL